MREYSPSGMKLAAKELKEQGMHSSTEFKAEMKRLRSGKVVEGGGSIPSLPSHPNSTLLPFIMHIRELKLLHREFRPSWPRRCMAFVASSKGFIGDGDSVICAANDACSKLIYFLEHQHFVGDPYYDPLSKKQDAESLALHGKLFMEKEMELEGLGEVTWEATTKCVILAEMLEGKILQIGWHEKGNAVWHPFRSLN